MSTPSYQMVWASVLAFSCIIIMLAVLLSVPFCMARVPFVNRLMGKLAQLMDVAPPVPNTHVMKGASEKMLRQLKVTWYQNKVDPEDPEPDTCPICFCEYNPGAALIKLDCGHFFHKECIRKWLKRDATCPMCKTGLTGSAHRRLQQQLQQQGVAEPDTPEALNVTAVQPGELDGSLAAAAAEQQELAPTAAAPGVQGQQPADLQPPAVHAASAAQLPLSTGVGQQQQS